MQPFEFDSWSARNESDLLRACWWHDHRTVGLLDWQEHHPAYCQLCRKLEPMKLFAGSDPAAVSTHESVLCSSCGLNARVRAVLDLLRTRIDLDEDKSVYMTEQVTPSFVWMQKNLPCSVIGSEYEPNSEKRKDLTERLHQMGGVGDVDFNDITASRYADAAFDAVVCFEVLEHVPDYRKALAELSRNLKQDGLLFATLPFADTEKTLVRARLDPLGNIEHLVEPEYHGDTISGGILCWYHFGWDLLDACVQSGFRSAKMVMPWNPAAGMHFGHWILMAQK